MKAALLLLAALHLPGQIQFEEIAGRAGLHFRLHSGARGAFHQIELMAGGLAALDYDKDGCTDLFFTNGAEHPALRKTSPAFHNRLFRNNCDLTFTDVTQKARVAGEGYSMAAAAGDFDNDGFADLFVAGVNRSILYRNRGDGVFEDVTVKAGLANPHPKYGKMWAISAGWFDADNDGWLDLVISNYVGWDPAREPPCGTASQRLYCHPHVYPGRPHQLFRNNRDGAFTDISEASGIGASIGKGMGVAFADFDGDGLTDVFVANDSVRNFLFRNLGKLRFTEMALMAGVAFNDDGRAVASMGADFRDFDNDGHPDLFFTAMLNDTFPLFGNRGKAPYFEDLTASSGLSLLTRRLTGWGAGLYDFDNDGHKDLFTANAHFPGLDAYLATPAPLANSIFRNLGNRRFRDVSGAAGSDFQLRAQHRGAAFADFDNDGRIDVAIAVMDGAAKLFRNTTAGDAHWIAFRLRGKRSNRDGLGAKLAVTLPDGRKLYNHATTSVGYASSSEPLVRFGLGGHTAVPQVEIRWPGGSLQTLRDVPAGRVIEVGEN